MNQKSNLQNFYKDVNVNKHIERNDSGQPILQY